MKFQIYKNFVPENVICKLFTNEIEPQYRYFYGLDKDRSYESLFEYDIECLIKNIANNGEKILRIVGKGGVLNNINV